VLRELPNNEDQLWRAARVDPPGLAATMADRKIDSEAGSVTRKIWNRVRIAVIRSGRIFCDFDNQQT
jgi:hypothetical protein